jgi:mobilization protein NikA
MTVQNLRIRVLVTPAQKARISKMAKEAGLPIGEFMRRAADSHLSGDDERLLEGMIRELEKSTVQTLAAADRAIAIIDASNRRIDAMLAGKPLKARGGTAARKAA